MYYGRFPLTIEDSLDRNQNRVSFYFWLGLALFSLLFLTNCVNGEEITGPNRVSCFLPDSVAFATDSMAVDTTAYQIEMDCVNLITTTISR